MMCQDSRIAIIKQRINDKENAEKKETSLSNIQRCLKGRRHEAQTSSFPCSPPYFKARTPFRLLNTTERCNFEFVPAADLMVSNSVYARCTDLFRPHTKCNWLFSDFPTDKTSYAKHFCEDRKKCEYDALHKAQATFPNKMLQCSIRSVVLLLRHASLFGDNNLSYLQDEEDILSVALKRLVAIADFCEIFSRSSPKGAEGWSPR